MQRSSDKEVQRQTFSFPVSLVGVVAPTDRAFLERWRTHLNLLLRQGFLTFWSNLDLLAGRDRWVHLCAQMDQAGCIILFVSADFFADNDCLALMQRALVRQQNNAAMLIPLLLSPADWQESELGILRCLPTNREPVTCWSNREEAWSACVQGLRLLLGLPAHLGGSSGRSLARSNANRKRMLRRLRRSYRKLLARSLDDMARLELGFIERPDAVQNVTNRSLRISPQAEQPLPPGRTIIHVYEDAEEELLILGEPGAGKSVELLRLAQHLVAQAEQDERCLLPIILPLSSWASKQNTLAKWMVEQISQDYDFPRKVSQKWMQNGQILPLLDGLDEMEESARPACVSEINTYHHDHPTPLVVCSRSAEYENAANRQRLALQSAVVIQPLTCEQVEIALSRSGEEMTGLRTALHERPELQDLATTPLMLNVLMRTYPGTTVYIDVVDETALEQRIWTDYVERMVERKGNTERYPLKQTYAWLGWLAQQMRKHNLSVFYAEGLGEDWLPDKLLRVYIWLAIRIPTATVGVIAGLSVKFFLSETDIGIVGESLWILLQIVLLSAFLGGWMSSYSEARNVSQTTPPSKKHPSLVLIARFGSNLVLGILFGIIASLNNENGISSGIMVGLSGLLLSFSLNWISKSSVYPLVKPIFCASVIGLIWIPAFALVSIWSKGWSCGVGPNCSGGLSYGLSLAFTGFLISFILENEGRISRLAERLHLSVRYLRNWGHIRKSLYVAGGSFLIFGLSDGWSDELSGGLSYGVKCGLATAISYGLGLGMAYWLIFGLYQGIVQERVEDEKRVTFNQGIRRSLLNGFCVSLAGGVMITAMAILIFLGNYKLSSGLIPWLNLKPSYPLSDGLHHMLSYSWFLIISGGLLLWATLGGLAVLRHYVIRFLLVCNRIFPWRAKKFLQYATTCGLLKQQGGGYSFYHRRLLDYFASQEEHTE